MAGHWRRNGKTSSSQSSNLPTKTPQIVREIRAYEQRSVTSPTQFPGLFELTPSASSATTTRRASGREGVFGDSHQVNTNLCQEGREYMRVCDHNLHSVLSKPTTSSWSDSLYDALTSQSKDPSSMNAEIQPLPGLPVVSKKDFEPFLRRCGEGQALFRKNHAADSRRRRSSTASNYVPDRKNSVSKPASAKAIAEDVAKCFRIVPKAFFQTTFDLTTEKLFESVILSKSLGNYDQLVGYLDRVELSLLNQISTRSDDFFEACSKQEDLRKQVTHACTQIESLRKQIKQFKTQSAGKLLEINQLRLRQERQGDLYQKLLLMRDLIQTEASVKALIHSYEFMDALDIILQARKRLNSDLKGVKCMESLGTKLLKYEELIAKQISEKLVAVIASNHWDFDYSSSIDKEVAPHKDNEVKRKQLKEEMTPFFFALLKIGAMNSVVKNYRARLIEEIKVVIKTVVNETLSNNTFTSDDGDDSSARQSAEEMKVAEKLKALTSEEFLACLHMIFEHLLIILQRVTVVHDLIVELYEAHNANDTVKSVAEENSVVSDSDEVVRKACSFSQNSVSNLFSVRKEIQSSYTMTQLQTLYDATMEFVQNIESITTKKDYTLRGALFSQLKLFLERYHNAQMSKLISTLDHEVWKSAEVAVHRQETLDSLESENISPSLLSQDIKILVDPAKRPSRTVKISGKPYRVVWSVLLLTEIVINYLTCVTKFPVLATDAMQRITEVLRLFNSRTTQLVLGAGAMQVARLKSISARHLALASQSLDFVVELLPLLRKFLTEHLPERQVALLEDLNKISSDYVEHKSKIFQKLTSIVEEQIMRKCLENGSLSSSEYDSDELQLPTIPLREIADGTCKLHAVLKPVLPGAQLHELFNAIYDMFSRELPGAFMDVTPSTDEGKRRVYQDVLAFVSKLRELKDVEISDTTLEMHFKNTYDK